MASDSSSLSDLTKSAAKSGKTAHFSPYFCANRTTIRLKSVKNCARLPLFSLRPIKSDRLLDPLEDTGCVGATEAERIGNGDVNLHFSCLIGAVIEITRFILIEDIDGRW